MSNISDTRLIPLSQGKFALIDASDYDFLIQRKWRCQKNYNNFYAAGFQYIGKYKYKKIYMHRLILNTPEDMHVDHINMDGLDNRRCNLRLVTKSQNMMNGNSHRGSSSSYKGVSWYKRKQKWQAKIQVNGRQIFLEYFTSETEAALAYNTAALKYFGEYARLNIIQVAA